ncbi:MAG: DUF5652 family protein [Nanoarchaeota archaeon]
MDYFTDMSVQLGIPLILLIVIIIWEVVWKLIAMWKAAKNNSSIWFVVLAVVNSVGILPILYIFLFSKVSKDIHKSAKKKKVSRRKR